MPWVATSIVWDYSHVTLAWDIHWVGVNAPHAPSVHEPAVCFSMCVWLYVWSVNCRHGISSKWYKHILRLRIERKQPDVGVVKCIWQCRNYFTKKWGKFVSSTVWHVSHMHYHNEPTQSARTSRSRSWRHTKYDVCAHRYLLRIFWTLHFCM